MIAIPYSVMLGFRECPFIDPLNTFVTVDTLDLTSAAVNGLKEQLQKWQIDFFSAFIYLFIFFILFYLC